MAKRFTDTDKWKRPWFRKLPPKAKLVWIYILDQCDHTGIWIADFDLLSFQLDFKISESEFVRFFTSKVLKIESDKYFIPSFYEFQYRDAKDTFKAKQAALKILSQYALINEMGTLGGQSTDCPGLSMDSPSIGIGISIGISNKEEGVGETKPNFDFEILYAKYPRKEGKSPGLKTCRAQITTPEDYNLLSLAIDRYIEHCRKNITDKKFIKMFSSFMSGWRDWLLPETGSTTELKPKSWLEEMVERERVGNENRGV